MEGKVSCKWGIYTTIQEDFRIIKDPQGEVTTLLCYD